MRYFWVPLPHNSVLQLKEEHQRTGFIISLSPNHSSSKRGDVFLCAKVVFLAIKEAEKSLSAKCIAVAKMEKNGAGSSSRIIFEDRLLSLHQFVGKEFFQISEWKHFKNKIKYLVLA